MLSDDEPTELADLHNLIEQITVDAYGDEGYWAFLQAFDDDVQFPIAATLAGVDVVVTGVDFDGNERRGIVATITRDGGQATAISVIDVAFPATEPRAAQLLAAYTRWLGIT
jgi:hypothetical protein